MLPFNPWEQQAQIKTLYSLCVEPVCKKYHITRTELDILLFLANNPEYDTAAEIVEVRYLTKSHVSTSIKHLEKMGFLQKRFAPDNHKVVHLMITEEAFSIVDDGKKALEKFGTVLFKGVTEEEWKAMEKGFRKMGNNMREYLEEIGKV